MQVLFPKTYQKFRSFDLARYKEIGKELKLVFNDDLSGTLTNLISHVEAPVIGVDSTKFWFLKPELCQKIRQQPSFKYLKVSAQVGQKLINGVHPSDILNYLDDTYYINTLPVAIKPNYTVITPTPASMTVSVSGSARLSFAQPGSLTARGPVSGTVLSATIIFPTTGAPFSVSVAGSATLTSAGNTTVVSTTVIKTLSLPNASTLAVAGSFSIGSGGNFSMNTTDTTSLLATTSSKITMVSVGGLTISTPSSSTIGLKGKVQDMKLISGAAMLASTDAAGKSTTLDLNKPGAIPISGPLSSCTLTNGQIDIPVLPISALTRQSVPTDASPKPSIAVSGSAVITLSESATGTATGSFALTATSASAIFGSSTTAMVTGTISLTNGAIITTTGHTKPKSVPIAAGTTIKLLAGTLTVPTGGSLSLTTDGAATLTSEASVSLNITGEAHIESRTTTPVNLTLTGNGQANLLSGTATLAHSYTTGIATPFSATSPATISTTGMSLTGTLGGTIVFVPDGAETATPMHQFGDAVHFYNILQRSLRDTSAIDNAENASVWINFEKLNKLKSVAEKVYFLALIYQEDKDFFGKVAKNYLSTDINSLTATSFVNGPLSCTACNTAFSTLKGKSIAELLSILTRMDEYIRLKKVSLTDEQNFLPFMQMTGELVQLGFSFANNNPAVNQRIRQYANLASEVYQIYNAVRVKNYANIPTHIGNVLKAIEEDSGNRLQTDLSGRIITAFQERLTPALSSLLSSTVAEPKRLYRLLKENLQESDKLAINYTTKQKLIEIFATNWTNESAIRLAITNQLTSGITYAPLLSDLIHRIDYWSGFTSGVVSATSSSEVNDVIRKFASPPSSFIDKRTNPFTITVSGMPGLFVGREKLDPNSRLSVPQNTTVVQGQTGTPATTPAVNTSLTADGGFKTTIGLSLPIGFDFSLRLGHRQDESQSSWSLGLFAQLIDLGAMLNYRLNTQANSLPDAVTLRSLVSPGLTLNAGLPNSPVTIGFGYQYTPALRHISKEAHGESTGDLLNAHRWQLRLAYDIPIFRIFGGRSGQ